MGRSLGVSDSTADIDSGTVLGVSSFSTASGSTVGFYGATPVARRASALQATLTLTTTTGGVGFVNTAQAQAVTDQLNEIRALLLQYGLWKGAA